MALESIRRTDIHNDYENAGGDNHAMTRNKRNSYWEESSLNIEMIERESVVGNAGERRYLGGLVGNKELLAMSALAVSSYLINGEYAQVVCTALTSVPPAVFSYRVLTSVGTSKEGYHSILFYWTLYGFLALIDQFVGTAQGYNLCKCGLLGFVFFHAIRSNLSAIPTSWFFLDPASADLVTSLFTRLESEGKSVRKTDTFELRTPTITHFSDDDSEFMLPDESSMYGDVSTACSFLPSLEMQTTQHMTKSGKSMQPSSPVRQQRHFETMSAMTETVGGSADIVAIPSDRITFSADSREALIQVTNVSPSHLMFALKTNADTYLVAAPTSGVLFSGQSMTVRVGVNETFFNDYIDVGKFTDKLAIDYTLIPLSLSASVSKFSLPFFQSHNRRRHAIRVFYN